MERLNITLDPESAARLVRLAERAHVQPGTLARWLLANALEDADPDPANLVALLDAIPGAYESAQAGRRQAYAGETIPLEDLGKWCEPS